MIQRILVVFSVAAIIFACAFIAGSNRASDVRREYDNAGKIISESQHDSEGRPHGTITLFAPDGSVSSVTKFYHGSWVSHREYHADGSYTDK